MVDPVDFYVNKFDNGFENPKSEYTFRFSISNNSKNSIIVKIKLSLIFNP